MPASAPLTGTAGFPAGPSLARLNAVPKTQEIAKTLQTQAKSIRSWTCGRGSAKSLRPQDRLMRASSPHQARPAGKPALPGKAGAPRESRRSQKKLGPPAFQPARLWRGSMPCQRRRKSRKPFKPKLNPSELDMREGTCQVAPAARSPDAGIEPASGEAGWKAGAPRESRRSQKKLGPPAFQPARLWRGSMPRQRRRKSRKPFKPKPISIRAGHAGGDLPSRSGRKPAQVGMRNESQHSHSVYVSLCCVPPPNHHEHKTALQDMR
jgi:hypothetical protein